MYNTSKATINTSEFISNYMPVGINQNIILKEVNVKKSQTNKDFLEIIFENENGQTAVLTEWKNEKNQWIKTDEDLQKRDNLQFGRLMQIINCYYPSIEDTTLNTFTEMINWVKSKLDSQIPLKTKLRLKVIYDKNGYTTISKNGIFVEPMIVEKSQITLFKKDILERTIQADNEQSADPLAGNASIPNNETITVDQKKDDLPF